MLEQVCPFQEGNCLGNTILRQPYFYANCRCLYHLKCYFPGGHVNSEKERGIIVDLSKEELQVKWNWMNGCHLESLLLFFVKKIKTLDSYRIDKFR